jgi:hypothetical protein
MPSGNQSAVKADLANTQRKQAGQGEDISRIDFEIIGIIVLKPSEQIHVADDKMRFYSIVQKGPDEYHVRARERKGLENLVAGVPFPGVEIKESEHTDYLARIIASKDDMLKLMRFLGDNNDYGNFKDKIDRTPDQRRKPYHEVWQVLADTLGVYGSNPID